MLKPWWSGSGYGCSDRSLYSMTLNVDSYLLWKKSWRSRITSLYRAMDVRSRDTLEAEGS